MDSFFELILNRLFLKPISIFFLILVSILFLATNYSDETGFNRLYILKIIIVVSILIAYSVMVYIKNRLPKIKPNKLGVLFVFHTENDTLYKEAKFKMVEYFKASSDRFLYDITPICINAEDIKKYNFADKDRLTKMLLKTGCVFAIDIVYQVDHINSAFNYELTINTAVRHPHFDEQKNTILFGELYGATSKIKNVKFNKTQKLDKIKFTANNLNLISKYIIGLVLLLSNYIVLSTEVLEDLYLNIDKNEFLYSRVKKAYYYSCFAMEFLYFEKFNDTGEQIYLDKTEECLNKINSLYRNSYGYCLDMAAVLVLKYNNISKAKELINICKKLNVNDNWYYSDAFLSAYSGDNANIVVKKYDKAVQSSYNIIRIIKFTEDKLEENPDKIMLHLALGLLYKNINQIKLMKKHLSLFKENYAFTNKDKTCKKMVENLLNISDDECLVCLYEDNCKSCASVT